MQYWQLQVKVRGSMPDVLIKAVAAYGSRNANYLPILSHNQQEGKTIMPPPPGKVSAQVYIQGVRAIWLLGRKVHTSKFIMSVDYFWGI